MHSKHFLQPYILSAHFNKESHSKETCDFASELGVFNKFIFSQNVGNKIPAIIYFIDIINLVRVSQIL